MFPGLLGEQVETVAAWPQDRVLQVNFRSGARLVFKLYGPRPNAIFRPAPDAPAQLFQQKLLADADLRPPAQRQLATQSANPQNPLNPRFRPSSRRRWPTCPCATCASTATTHAPPEAKARLVNQVLAQLEKPAHYYLIQLDGRTRLSLLPLGEVLETFAGDDPMAALRRFVPMALGRRALETETRQLRQLLERRADEASTAAAHARQRLHALAHEAGYRHTADLIMANLHDIPAGATQIEVLDFYTNQPRLIKLKRTEKPQRTAENLYRKAKNQQIEERQLTERIARREAEALDGPGAPGGAGHPARPGRAARPAHLAQAARPRPHGQRRRQSCHGELPFKVFEDRGFTILVGRNAANNDLLTQKYAHKDDLWLHAKDVTGSHVVIRHRAGQPVPEPVVEHAAMLAGWYSQPPARHAVPGHGHAQEICAQAAGRPAGPGSSRARAGGAGEARQPV